MNKKTMMAKKIQGGSMLLAVFAMTIITLITFLIIGLNYYNNNLNRRVANKHQCRINISNGFILAEAEPDLFPTYETTQYSLFGDGDDSIEVKRYPWGYFDVIKISSNAGKDSISGIGLMISETDKESTPVLQIAQAAKRIRVTGKTFIVGKCFIPGEGFNAGSFSNSSYSGQIPEQTQLKETTIFPQPSKNMDSLKTEIIFEKYLKKAKKINPQEWAGFCSHYGSFAHEAEVLYSEEDMQARNVEIKGKKVLICNGVLRIGNDCHLQDAILIARGVIFEEGFEGSVQVFATDSIIAKSNTKLKFPSVFSIYTTNDNRRNAKIETGENGSFEGLIIAWSETPCIQHHFRVSLGKNSKTKGTILCCDYCEPRGEFTGSLVSRKLLYTSGSGSEENLLKDVKLEAFGHDDLHICVKMENTKELRKIKWLR